MSLKKLAQSLFGCKRMSALPAGEVAPPFSLANLEGNRLALGDALKAGPVLAAFFKVSCPVCQFTFPFLQRIYERHGSDKLTFWAISQNDAEDTRDFLERYGVKFAALLDDAGYPVSNAYGITNVPTVFLIGSDGKVEMTSVGFSKADLDKMAAAAAQAAGKAPNSVFAPGESVPAYKPG